MTGEEAAAILGPELTAKVRANPELTKPLTAEQRALLVRLLSLADEAPASDAA